MKGEGVTAGTFNSKEKSKCCCEQSLLFISIQDYVGADLGEACRFVATTPAQQTRVPSEGIGFTSASAVQVADRRSPHSTFSILHLH